MKLGKTTSLFLCFALLCMLLGGCGFFSKDNEPVDVELPEEEDIKESGEYILTATDGSMILFDSNGKQLSSLNLGKGKKSDFLYSVDNGSVYALSIASKPSDGYIIYAVDRGNAMAYMISCRNDKLKELESKSIKDRDITEVQGYNGTLYYSVVTDKKSSNKFTYIKPEKSKNNGIIDYYTKIPEPWPSKTATYIVSVSFYDSFESEMKYSKLSSYDKQNIEKSTYSKTQTFKIPCEINSWTVSGDNIFFFYEGRMGQYIMSKNQIGLYFGPISPIDSVYMDGRFSSAYIIANFGEGSTKTVLFGLNAKDMLVNTMLEIGDTPSPKHIALDKSGYLSLVASVDGDKYFSIIRTYTLDTYTNILNVPVSYVPMTVNSHNGRLYLFNSKENYFLICSLESGNLTEVSKEIKGINYDGILLVNNLRVDRYLYNSSGEYIDESGIKMLADGSLVNNKEQRVNRFLQIVDDYGRAINENGELIDRYGNVIDENGTVLSYTLNPDGLYRTSNGKVCDQNGKLLRLVDDKWVDPDIIEDDVMTGHFDENGEFIIDADYLERHPDAYEVLEAQNNTDGKS